VKFKNSKIQRFKDSKIRGGSAEKDVPAMTGKVPFRGFRGFPPA
jgi:hypothetical protein